MRKFTLDFGSKVQNLFWFRDNYQRNTQRVPGCRGVDMFSSVNYSNFRLFNYFSFAGSTRCNTPTKTNKFSTHAHNQSPSKLKNLNRIVIRNIRNYLNRDERQHSWLIGKLIIFILNNFQNRLRWSHNRIVRRPIHHRRGRILHGAYRREVITFNVFDDFGFWPLDVFNDNFGVILPNN